MPIYEYRCTACNAELEKIQKVSDPPLVECPECNRPALMKLVSASSFRLKGSGWYESDFKTGKKKNGLADAGETSSPDSSNKEGGNATAGDAAKPAADQKAAPAENAKTGNSSAKPVSGPAGSSPAP
jgi:putative FmdB family regulatory protein